MIDPFVRLRLSEFQGLRHTHLLSEFDSERRAGQSPCSGYTEWVSRDRLPALTFSWDWSYDQGQRQFEAHWHTLRTNLRVVDEVGADLGAEFTASCVAREMARLGWQSETALSLGLTVDALQPGSPQ